VIESYEEENNLRKTKRASFGGGGFKTVGKIFNQKLYQDKLLDRHLIYFCDSWVYFLPAKRPSCKLYYIRAGDE
jgi:hypothetical protein